MFFPKLESLALHLKSNPQCKTNENLKYLSKNGVVINFSSTEGFDFEQVPWDEPINSELFSKDSDLKDKTVKDNNSKDVNLSDKDSKVRNSKYYNSKDANLKDEELIQNNCEPHELEKGKLIRMSGIHCKKCNMVFPKLESLVLHLKSNPQCKTNENLKNLSKNGIVINFSPTYGFDFEQVPWDEPTTIGNSQMKKYISKADSSKDNYSKEDSKEDINKL